jgi:hypothetical protein
MNPEVLLARMSEWFLMRFQSFMFLFFSVLLVLGSELSLLLCQLITSPVFMFVFASQVKHGYATWESHPGLGGLVLSFTRASIWFPFPFLLRFWFIAE